jgi:uncharacterized protein (DUF1778 family)
MPSKRSIKSPTPKRSRKEERIQVRMTTEQRRAMERAANRAGLDLSAYIRMAALKAAGESE